MIASTTEPQQEGIRREENKTIFKTQNIRQFGTKIKRGNLFEIKKKLMASQFECSRKRGLAFFPFYGAFVKSTCLHTRRHVPKTFANADYKAYRRKIPRTEGYDQLVILVQLHCPPLIYGRGEPSPGRQRIIEQCSVSRQNYNNILPCFIIMPSIIDNETVDHQTLAMVYQ